MLKRLIVAFTLPLLLSLPSLAADREAEVLKAEFKKLYSFVIQLEPDGQIGDFMNYKIMDGYEILWDLEANGNSYDVITLYREVNSKNPEEFSVSFYRGTHLVEGRNVIRRFIGPVVSGWRNDTADIESGEYLGSQGHPSPAISDEDHKILKKWEIEIF